MGDVSGDHLGLAGATDALGARGHHGNPVVEQHLNDASISGNSEFCARTVQHDGELMVTGVTGGVNRLRSKTFNVWNWSAKTRAGFFNSGNKWLWAAAVHRGVGCGLAQNFVER